MDKIFYKKALKAKRRQLRQSDIACEKIFWNKIRNSKIGFKFRRQVSIGNFIVDFYCYELKLIIEIDGATHGTNEEIAYDNKRQNYLKGLNLHIRRYLNIDIKERLPDVMFDLQEFCENLKHTSPRPSP